MDDHSHSKENRPEILEAAFHSPISALDMPEYIITMLEQNGFHNAGELIQAIQTDKERILEIKGIGPKIFEQIDAAANSFEPQALSVKLPYHPPPVPTLADFYKPPLGIQAKPPVDDDHSEKGAKTITYNPPVPSLADYFDPENMVVVVETVPSKEIADKGKGSKKEKTKIKTPKEKLAENSKKTPKKKDKKKDQNRRNKKKLAGKKKKKTNKKDQKNSAKTRNKKKKKSASKEKKKTKKKN